MPQKDPIHEAPANQRERAAERSFGDEEREANEVAEAIAEAQAPATRHAGGGDAGRPRASR